MWKCPDFAKKYKFCKIFLTLNSWAAVSFRWRNDKVCNYIFFKCVKCFCRELSKTPAYFSHVHILNIWKSRNSYWLDTDWTVNCFSNRFGPGLYYYSGWVQMILDWIQNDILESFHNKFCFLTYVKKLCQWNTEPLA